MVSPLNGTLNLADACVANLAPFYLVVPSGEKITIALVAGSSQRKQ